MFTARAYRQELKRARLNQLPSPRKMHVQDLYQGDTYENLTINCRHRPVIKEMVAEVRNLNRDFSRFHAKWK